MTDMQLAYSQHLEQVRHNKKQEELGMQELKVKAFDVNEKARHNLATEELSAADLQEKIRHNIVNDNELLRHNQATESEIQRHNIAVEQQAKAENNIRMAIAKLDSMTKLATASQAAEANKQVALIKANTDAYRIATDYRLRSLGLEQEAKKIQLSADKLKQDAELKHYEVDSKVNYTWGSRMLHSLDSMAKQVKEAMNGTHTGNERR